MVKALVGLVQTKLEVIVWCTKMTHRICLLAKHVGFGRLCVIRISRSRVYGAPLAMPKTKEGSRPQPQLQDGLCGGVKNTWSGPSFCSLV